MNANAAAMVPSLKLRAPIAAFLTGLIGAFAIACPAVAAAPHVLAQKLKVTLRSGDTSLVGYLYRPDGDGPFPGIVWNHGSEKNPGRRQQFDAVASIFVPAGYVVFAPVRRGHGESDGHYIVDAVSQTRKLSGWDAASRTVVQLLETQQLDDQLAGLAYVKQLPFVDTRRIAVGGCSFGGIETLLGAESDAGYHAAIALSPGAQSWAENRYLQQRLVAAVRRIDVPVLLLQPAHDASLAPGRVLGAAAAKAGKPLTVKVYPATGPKGEQRHCFGGAAGMHVWAEDAKAFLAEKMR